MKLIYLFLCFVLIWNNNYVNGDLRGFFNGIHEAASKMHQDVRTILHIKPNGNQDKPVGTDDKTVTTEKSKGQETIITQDNDRNAALNTKNDGPQKTVTEVTATTTDAAPKPNNSEGGKEGKDNLNGSVCIAGFVRTADGRCKPTFG